MHAYGNKHSYSQVNFKLFQYQWIAISPNLMLTKVTRYNYNDINSLSLSVVLDVGMCTRT